MLSGAAGQLYGSAHTWQLQKGWEANLDTPGVIQLSYMKNLFVSRKWYDLIPDQTHTVVTAGYDRFSCIVGNFVAYVSERPRLPYLKGVRSYPKVFGHWIHNKQYLRDGCPSFRWLAGDGLHADDPGHHG